MKEVRLFSLFILLCGAASVAIATSPKNELDQDGELNAPKAIVVRVQENTKDTAVFKADLLEEVSPADARLLEMTLDKVEKDDLQLKEFKSIDLSKDKDGELDQDTSTQSWYYYYYGRYWANTSYFYYSSYYYTWGYSYHYRGYTWYYYYPYYGYWR